MCVRCISPADKIVSTTGRLWGSRVPPSARVTWSETGDFYGAVVCNLLTATTYGGIHADQSLQLELLDVEIKRTSLVEWLSDDARSSHAATCGVAA